LPDPDKYGWTVPELLIDLPQLDRLEQIQIKGLMAIPPLGLTTAATQQFFEQARDLSSQLQQQNWANIHLSELSLGMSGDYLQAISAGSTIVRLGSIIFGDRIK
jgi:PLP dependent protein